MNASLSPGEIVRLRLSPEGEIALRGFFERSDFEVYVTGSDDLGIWVDLGDSTAVLLKWQYLATVVAPIRYMGGPEQDVRRIGF
jgi:hypothetical protein